MERRPFSFSDPPFILVFHSVISQLSKESMKGTKKKTEEDFLQSLSEATASVTGADFFRSLVRNLASTLQVRYAFVAECQDESKTRVRTLEFWEGECFSENFEYDVRGTPCEKVIEGTVCYYTENVQALFPEDEDLVRLNLESYLGIPLSDDSGEVMGHLVVLGDTPLDRGLSEVAVLLKIFSAQRRLPNWSANGRRRNSGKAKRSSAPW